LANDYYLSDLFRFLENENMTKPIIKTATASDEAYMSDVLVLAFSTDPGARWTWPDPHQYLMNFPKMIKLFGGKAFEHGSAYYAAGYGGAALWLPPGVRPDEEAMTALFQQTASGQILKDLTAVFEKMESYHPAEPHWYLPLIGVDPFLQGNGLGSALMKHALIPCDRDNKFAFLESTNSKNIPLYERHGFTVLNTIQVGTSPTIFPMLRKPQK
jgi:ribosomal protein S18 acetylase RimI-like enzyme